MTSNTRTRNRIALILFVLLVFIVGISVVRSIGFSQNPAISPTSPITGDSLNCTWRGIANSTSYLANVSWYNNSVYYTVEADINCSNTSVCTTPLGIASNFTFRDDTWNCSVAIYDPNDPSGGLINISTVVNISNADPVIVSIGNQTVLEDSVFSTTMTAIDAEGDNIRWFSYDNNFSGDPLFTINMNSGLISFTPDSGDVGNHTMDIIALDTNEGSDTAISVFWIKEVDDNPQFSPALTDQTAYEGTVFSYGVSATDEENDNISFNLTSPTISNLTLSVVDNDTVNVVFNHTDSAPAYSDVGNHTVNIIVWETKNGSVMENSSFNLEIVSVNHDPVLANISNQSGVQNQTSNFTMDVSAEDIDSGDTLTFSITTNCSYPNPWVITTNDNDNNATAYINQSLNNTNVICKFVTITVSDGLTSDSQIVHINITNSNDPPVISNNSAYAENNAGSNTSNLTGYYGTTFKYRVNASDIDTLTTEGDTLTYTTNDTLFPINSGTGLIQVTINDSLIGNHSVLVNVTDLGLVSRFQEINITIINNTIPVLNAIAPLSCAEDLECNAYIGAYDPDLGENLSFGTNDTTRFPMTYHNVSAVLFNLTPDQSMVGNYSIVVNVTDQHGATDNETFVLQINNTNDVPYFDMNRDNTTDNISLGTIVENREYLYTINVTDEDLEISDILTFNVVYLIGSSLFNVTKTGDYSALINITPNTTSDGNYSVNISVVDSAGAYDWQTVNFTVYNESAAPNISRIKPYYNDTLVRTVFDYVNASIFRNRSEIINMTENSSVTFNASAYDADGALADTTFYWYRNGSLNHSISGTSNEGYALSWGFADAGQINITLVVEDALYSQDRFTWLVTIGDINRPPVLLNDLINLTGANAINLSVQLDGYFSYYSSAQRFLDPDDDLNGNNQIRDEATDPGESFGLTVTSTACGVATLTQNGDTLIVTPTLVGTCYVTFTATDSGGLSVASNQVRIDVENVPSGSVAPVPVATSTTGGGTTSISQKIIIPQKEDHDVPKPVEIIVPGTVIIYENQTMKIPITVVNNWNGTLTGIKLGAYTNNSAVEMEFTNDFIQSLESGDSSSSYLIVTNYREQGPYEIQVIATVADPSFTDTGTIFVNSIEQTGAGNQVEVKIAFAKDLLTSNAECQELAELLSKAELAQKGGNIDQALNIVDSVVNGCKYMINDVNRQKELESPTQSVNLLLYKLRQDYFHYALLGIGLLILSFLVVLVVLRKQEINELRKLE